VFKTTKRLVDDNREKAVYSVRAAGVPDAPSSRCASRTPCTEHSDRQTKNASSRRTGRHGASLMSFSSLAASRQCHGARSATVEAGMSDRHRDKPLLATSNDTALKDRASSGTVSIQTNSERQSHCNGGIVMSASQRQSDNKPVKIKRKKRNRNKPDGLLQLLCHSVSTTVIKVINAKLTTVAR